MSKQDFRERGFRAGYHHLRQRQWHQPWQQSLPIDPTIPKYLIHDADRSVWLEAWASGRALARRHRAELDTAVERLTEETVS